MYENKTYENIKQNILDAMNGLNIEEGTFINDMVSPISVELESAYRQFDTIISMIFINGLQGSYLDVKASEYGIYRKVDILDNIEVKESDDELKKRLLTQIKAPAASGNIADYVKWCTQIPNITDAKVIPLWDGNGTVKVLPVNTDKLAPTVEEIQSVTANIEKNRPIGATVTVTAPTEVAISVNATITLKDVTQLEQAKIKYTDLLNSYLKNSVFKLNTVDYYKCLSFWYELEEIQTVNSFKLNNGVTNILISDTEIQVIGIVTVEVSN